MDTPDLSGITHPAVADWANRGQWIPVEIEGETHQVFVLDVPATTDADRDPLLVLHGFPSSSFDWRHVLDAMARGRRVVLFDFLGFGLSDKPDRTYPLGLHADVATAVIAQLGLTRVVLVTHDIGDSVGGELLARQLDGTLDLEVGARVLMNGSIYMDLVQLSAGQQFLLGLPDERYDPVGMGFDPAAAYRGGVAGTFAAGRQPSEDELDAQWQLAAWHEGYRMLPRGIRYVEDRRVNEGRYTGAIETHPSPLTIVWGDEDPIARYAMAERLAQRRPDATLVTLDGVGHYPMVEDPTRVATAIAAAVARA